MMLFTTLGHDGLERLVGRLIDHEPIDQAGQRRLVVPGFSTHRIYEASQDTLGLGCRPVRPWLVVADEQIGMAVVVEVRRQHRRGLAPWTRH